MSLCLQLTELPAGSAFHARVRARNRAGWSEASPPSVPFHLQASTAPTQAAAAAILSAPVAILKSSTAVVIGWRRAGIDSRGQHVTGFMLQYCEVTDEVLYLCPVYRISYKFGPLTILKIVCTLIFRRCRSKYMRA